MNFFDHKDLGNHLLQLYPKVVIHPVYIITLLQYVQNALLATIFILLKRKRIRFM
jgi:hypothetical protein